MLAFLGESHRNRALVCDETSRRHPCRLRYWRLRGWVRRQWLRSSPPFAFAIAVALIQRAESDGRRKSDRPAPTPAYVIDEAANRTSATNGKHSPTSSASNFSLRPGASVAVYDCGRLRRKYQPSVAAFLRLQGPQSNCRFRSVFAPPMAKGMMWSNSNRSQAPHSMQRPRSRCQTECRTDLVLWLGSSPTYW
jgi:hypothetical protein